MNYSVVFDEACQKRWISEKMSLGQDKGGVIEKEDPFMKLLEANKERMNAPKGPVPWPMAGFKFLVKWSKNNVTSVFFRFFFINFFLLTVATCSICQVFDVIDIPCSCFKLRFSLAPKHFKLFTCLCHIH